MNQSEAGGHSSHNAALSRITGVSAAPEGFHADASPEAAGSNSARRSQSTRKWGISAAGSISPSKSSEGCFSSGDDAESVGSASQEATSPKDVRSNGSRSDGRVSTLQQRSVSDGAHGSDVEMRRGSAGQGPVHGPRSRGQPLKDPKTATRPAASPEVGHRPRHCRSS